MRGSRLATRLAVLPRAGWRIVATAGRRERTERAETILVAHSLLLGDTVMLTPLLAKLRERYPQSDIAVTVAPSIAVLYSTHPYGARAIPFDPKRGETAHRLFRRDGYDLAIVPGDNRYAWTALAAGARWIVAFAGDRPAHKNWAVDELVELPKQPVALSDIFASLVDDAPPAPYRRRDWPTPRCQPFEPPPQQYAVLHVGAGSPLRLWAPEKWRAVADWLAARGIQPVWSAAANEAEIVRAIDSAGRFASYAGRLDLAQLWHLLERAALLVTLDTGVMHIAKLTLTPTVALFGPGSHVLFGPGRFWQNSPFRSVTIDSFPCRDQRTLFKREIEWVRRCQRSTNECADARCMSAIGVDRVLLGAGELLSEARR